MTKDEFTQARRRFLLSSVVLHLLHEATLGLPIQAELEMLEIPKKQFLGATNDLIQRKLVLQKVRALGGTNLIFSILNDELAFREAIVLTKYGQKILKENSYPVLKQSWLGLED